MNSNYIKSACIIAGIALASCGQSSNTEAPQTVAASKDLMTQSNGDSIILKHLELDLKVDFEQKRVAGSAHWTFSNPYRLTTLKLDSDNLLIDSITVGGEKVAFTLGEKVPYLGQSLWIPVKENSSDVVIYYQSGADAPALQWLAPSQTESKKSPFLYTQCEPVYARSWIPCADGPSFRYTYNARIEVPRGLMALMSAENPQQVSDSGIYHFKMDIPVPAYLMALAVGDIRFKAIDDRTGVYAEPAMIARAAKEFEDVGSMVHTAEKLYGPYRWGRYDMLVLPPGFPIGGMENPRLTFCTPTIIAGDKSLVNLIAHELAHSWSGNLVTNATWNDIWMNEGFTVYFERRISEAMNGKSYADMLWVLGYQDLEAEIDYFGKESAETWLKLNLKDKDPGGGLSDIAYEKGALFLLHIEKLVGRRKFDDFLNKYFSEHAFKTITTEQFLAYLKDKLVQNDTALLKNMNIDAWVYGPGIPAGAPDIRSERFENVDKVRAAFLSSSTVDTQISNAWTTHEWLHFLRKMPETFNKEQMQVLDRQFRFTNSQNSEIADLWFEWAIKNNYTTAFPAMELFLSRVGRQKFLEPLYRAMLKYNQKEKAQQLFEKYRQNYHPLAQKNIGNIVSGAIK